MYKVKAKARAARVISASYTQFKNLTIFSMENLVQECKLQRLSESKREQEVNELMNRPARIDIDLCNILSDDESDIETETLLNKNPFEDFPSLLGKRDRSISKVEIVTRSRTPMAKKWVFTWCNYPADGNVKLAKYLNEHCKRYQYQSEICPQKQTPHIQGWCEFKSKTRAIPHAKKRLNAAFHWEIQSSADDYKAIDYCRKSDSHDGKLHHKSTPWRLLLQLVDFDYTSF